MPLAFEVEKFDGEKHNFAIWRLRVRDLLVVQGQHEALPLVGEGCKPEGKSDDDWKVVDRKALSLIRLCLTDGVLLRVIGEKTAAGLWAKLESLYLDKSHTNRIHLKWKFYSLMMQESMTILDYLNAFNAIVFQLESIGVEIVEENKVLRLLSSLPKSFKTIVNSLYSTKKDPSFDSVCVALLDYEFQRTLVLGCSEGNSDETPITGGRSAKREASRGSKFHLQSKPKEKACWLCGESGHLVRNCSERGD